MGPLSQCCDLKRKYFVFLIIAENMLTLGLHFFTTFSFHNHSLFIFALTPVLLCFSSPSPPHSLLFQIPLQTEPKKKPSHLQKYNQANILIIIQSYYLCPITCYTCLLCIILSYPLNLQLIPKGRCLCLYGASLIYMVLFRAGTTVTVTTAKAT